MRRVQSDSGCEHGSLGYHLWFVYAHDKNWRVVDCICGRCGAASRMQYSDYTAILDARERAWAAKHDRHSSPSQRNES